MLSRPAAQAAPDRLFRVNCEFAHAQGGFGYTRPFPSAVEAEAWARSKAGNRPDAHIEVIARGPASVYDVLGGPAEADVDELSPGEVDAIAAALGAKP